MNKGKWILLGVLMLIPGLIRLIMVNYHISIPHETSLWLFLAIGTILAMFSVIPKQYKKFASWFAILFLVLTLSAVHKNKNDQKPPKNQGENPGQTVKIVQTQVHQGKSSEVTQTSWGYVVNFTGREFEGVPIFTAEEEKEVLIRWLEGGKICNPEGQINHTDPYGGDVYTEGWKNRFRFGWCPDVKPHAALVLIKKVGDTLDSVRQEDVLFFKKGEKEIQLQMNAGEELLLYYHDVNDEHYFRRNGADGSYMRFEVEIL